MPRREILKRDTASTRSSLRVLVPIFSIPFTLISTLSPVSRAWRAAFLKSKQFPPYHQELLKLLADNPLSVMIEPQSLL